MIIDALRRANSKALSTPAIADAIIASKGYGAEAKYALIRRVRANLSYLLRHREAVEKVAQSNDGAVAAIRANQAALDFGKGAKWPLVTSDICKIRAMQNAREISSVCPTKNMVETVGALLEAVRGRWVMAQCVQGDGIVLGNVEIVPRSEACRTTMNLHYN